MRFATALIRASMNDSPDFGGAHGKPIGWKVSGFFITNHVGAPWASHGFRFEIVFTLDCLHFGFRWLFVVRPMSHESNEMKRIGMTEQTSLVAIIQAFRFLKGAAFDGVSVQGIVSGFQCQVLKFSRFECDLARARSGGIFRFVF